MNKSTQNFWIDIGLFSLLMLTVLTATVEIFVPCFVHVFLGLSLSLAALVHVALHWDWIKSTANRFGRLPDQVRVSFLINLGLFIAYGAAAGMGLIARSFIFFGPLRHFLGFLHVLLVMGLITLQTVHLARHWKWLKVNAKKAIG